MNKKLKTSVFFLIPIILITLFSNPQIASASWWNPFTWFKKEIKLEQVITPPQQAPILKQENTEVKEEVPKIIQKPTEAKKVISEKVISTDIPPPVFNTSVIIPPKENYKLEDIVKAWQPYVVKVTCTSLDSQGNTKSSSSGSGFLSSDPVRGASILTNKHIFYNSDGISSDYCDIYFSESKDVVRVEKKDRYISNKGYDKGTLVISKPSEYVASLINNSQITSRDCKNTKPDSTDDLVILGYPKDSVSYSRGKITGYTERFFVSSAIITDGYSGGISVSLKDNCYLGIPTYSGKDDSSKSFIFDVNKF